ncbi:hypothetical protein ABEB36_010612 [Hypothenemus hampei]|uniref:Non-homologous end-joining factor 1 n=1 Tax=Hypothenemus hampei TaxID=57062 RepID=A0ABD1ECK2_HYPHA
MWRLFSDNKDFYMLRVQNEGNSINLSVTDLLLIWRSQLSESEIVKNFKENNSNVSAGNEDILSGFFDLIKDSTIGTIFINEKNKEFVEVILENSEDSAMATSKITYKFKLCKAEQQQFRNELTVPSIQTIYLLEKQKELLLSVIKKKDRELEEYKMEKGGLISRSDLITEKFDSCVLDSDEQETGFFNLFTKQQNEDFWLKLTENNGEIKKSNLSIEVEPWNAQPKRKITHSVNRKPCMSK